MSQSTVQGIMKQAEILSDVTSAHTELRTTGSLGTSSLSLYVSVACHWLPPRTVSLSRVQSLLYVILSPNVCVFLMPLAIRQGALSNLGFTANSAKKLAAMEKVFVVLPAEFKAGQSTLSWVLDHFSGGRTTVVITHVHVPPQMIPVMGVKFHSSKLSPEQVKLFRRIEYEKVDKQLDGYVHQCSKMKVKCEKLVFEKEDDVAGLIELIVLHKVTKLIISGAADRQYSRKMDKPKSKTATEIMQRADPSCKIWCVCKGQLICTRGEEEEIAPSATPFVPDFDHQALQLVPYQKEDDVKSELGLYDELKEACIAAENLMKRALNESSRRQKADGEVASALQKAKEYQELYLEETRKREELEGALARAHREIARLRQANQVLPLDEQNKATDELQEAMSERSSLEGHIFNMDAVFGTAAGQATEQQQKEHVQIQFDLGTGEKDLELELELEALLNQSKLAAFSPSSVIQSPYEFDEDRVPSYFLCPILQEAMRDPHVAADGFTYEGDAIRGWLDGGNDASPVTGQPLAHRELAPNLALAAVIQDYTVMMMKKRRQYRFGDSHDNTVAALQFLSSPVGSER
ncbi:hypothetical protein BDA96_01G327200 [Sorghum bicolor]|uniref:RING-type E3 ubiquitin transferase n=4 Tax=Sorghum bicolor TaxID=4558 RepID=A0A921V073_SORBI|nr:U-box domain-containing protein 36 isoform X2 [Sorghum bicolor]KAG0550303.1 hypothetical protein BDA96_01G327200 [Sorghum bicolor]OQU92181.1 hypothetical protein SORBI_3001G305800 [Sorghum bicolor]|eukprot:XP_021306857.1 U-box domain-containing protein 36 isoform X2 [Sorghum bicolor]